MHDLTWAYYGYSLICPIRTLVTCRTRTHVAKRPRCGDRRCGSSVSGRAARAPTLPTPAGLPHDDRVQLPGTDMRAYCFASYSAAIIAVVCLVDVNHLGSAGAHMLDFRGFSALCFEAYPGPCTYTRNGGPIVLQWKRIWHDGQR